MTPKQIKYVRVLLYREGIPAEEEDMAFSFSNERTTKLEELTQGETQALIEDLNGKSPKDKMTAKILSLAHEMHWKKPCGKIDMKRINDWCMKSTSFHRPLDQLTDKELPKVVTVFEIMYKSFLKSI